MNITPLAGFPAGASWGPDNRIVFSYGASTPLHVVDAGGGPAEVLPAGQAAYGPEVLPNGRTPLYRDADGWVHAFNRRAERKTRLIEGTPPRFANGHLIVANGTNLLAAPFDVSRHALTAPAIPFAEGVAVESSTAGGPAHYAISRTGTLTYLPPETSYSLLIVRSDGTEHRLGADQFRFKNLRFSPEGDRVVVAVRRREDEPSDLWMYDVVTGAATRLPPYYDDYDIHRDGRTLVVVRPANPVQLREVSITLNWPEQLKPLSHGDGPARSHN